MSRTILHCDCNAFFASCEEIKQPELRNVPMAVGGSVENRHGIILAKNEKAKKYDIKTAETIWQARKKCNELVIVPPHHDEYLKYSKLINEIYQSYTDLVEPFGIDESWLDITNSMHLFGSASEVADNIRETVKAEIGLTISVGVSDNKAWAKLGSDYKKPDATTIFKRNECEKLIFALPVADLIFVGRNTECELKKMNITTIGQLARADKKLIVDKLGRAGEMVYNYANGIDESPVRAYYDEREAKSVGNGITFKRNLRSWAEIRAGVELLVQEVSARMRRHNVKCCTLHVAIKDADFKTVSKQKQLEVPTNLSVEMSDSAMDIIRSFWSLDRAVRMLTITGANLVAGDYKYEQISLFNGEESKKREKYEKLDKSLDTLKEKFGDTAVVKCSVIDNDLI